MYKHILLASDGSENAVRAAKEAVKIASCTQDSVIDVIYVVDFDKSKSDVLHSGSSEAIDIERRKKNSKVIQFLNDANVNYKTTILHGKPGPEIVKYANDKKVDLVIIGSRGLNALQEMVLGSVSHKVMKRVNCPALIVK
ncbi:universal stress protein [Ureibacillus chungkukjangi]|uniref:Nucleotide-binding universal stress UspA family protein n=1 Tax=Ureibacillus chungkukjangi TaxID=1202712 RepID=A0A318TQU6_9BACL|nr:universal stress protein [Ureibacillus chungkukjangi]MCM3388162.1 universal stress protein [Ureibacillus chungkukjangi]MDI7743993.1 universal stress protein [Lysinibacillus fusiformis]PYF06180.1 nucleotide-binding universal stress UspA family protein [Ureibacillus chungkukjangi]